MKQPTISLPCGCILGPDRHHCPESFRLWEEVERARKFAEREGTWGALDDAIDAALRHVEDQLKPEVSHGVADRDRDLGGRVCPGVGPLPSGCAGGQEVGGAPCDGGAKDRQLRRTRIVERHTVAVLSRQGTRYDAATVYLRPRTSRPIGAALRIVQFVPPGGVPLCRQRIQYDTVHADSGIVGHRDVIDAYLLNQERSS